MNSRQPIALSCLAILFLVAAGPFCLGAADETTVQEAAEQKVTDALTPAFIRELVEQIEKAADLDEAAREKILGLYRQALQDLEMADVWESRGAEYAEIAETAEAETSAAKEILAALPAEPDIRVPEDASLERQEELLAAATRRLEQTQATLANAEAEPRRRTIRRVEIQKLLKTARDRLAELEKQPSLPFSKTGIEPAELARRVRLRAGRVLARQTVAAYEQELAAYDATADLLPVRVDIESRRTQLAKETVFRLEERVSAARKKEAEHQVRAARMEAALVHPAIRDVAAVNESLAGERRELMNRVEKEAKTLGRVKEMTDALQKEIAAVQDKIQSVGHTGAVGLMLRTQRAALPDMYEHTRAVRLRRDEIPAVQLQLFNLAENRARLANLDALARTVLDGLPPGERDENGELAMTVRELLQTQKDYVDLLTQEYNKYFKTLVDLDNAQRGLVAASENYQDYIDEHVLWIASAPTLWDSKNWHLNLATRWLFTPREWAGVAASLAGDVMAHFLTWLGAFFGLCAVAYASGKTRTAIVTLGERAAATGNQAFLPTARVTFLTVLIAAVPFTVPAFLAWRLAANAHCPDFARVLAIGLWSVVAVYFPVEIFRQACREGGLAQKHFGWPAHAVRRLHRYTGLLTVATLPLFFTAVISNTRQDARWQDSIGRLCFVVAMCLVACGLYRLLRRKGELVRSVLAEHPDDRYGRVFGILVFLGTAVPLALAALAVLGYYYTAWQLASRWLETALLAAGLFLSGAFLLRWVFIVRRRLAIQRARKQIQANTTELVVDDRGSDSPEPVTPVPFDPEIDLAKINLQARRLVYTGVLSTGVAGLWFIWAGVFPALGILKQVELWEAAVETTQIERTADGTTTVSTIPQYRKVTAADLAWAVFVVLLTFFGARNFPGLLEIFLLQYLPLDKGLRYAICAVFRYVLVGVGVAWCALFIGITWTKVQWILAAMSVGLGFGLQEVFANFVSGLILLFERPIRVGDVITIGDATGKVTRIQIRATTIEDWDRKELVVPNKEFATGRLLNWTLTNNINRLVLEVGVSYDSDPDQIRTILLKIAADHPKVLDNPKPIAIFQEFESSSLQFSLRVYLPSMTGRLNIKHQLNTAIHRELRAAGVTIAYPQLDLHLKREKAQTQSPVELEPELVEI